MFVSQLHEMNVIRQQIQTNSPNLPDAGDRVLRPGTPDTAQGRQPITKTKGRMQGGAFLPYGFLKSKI